MTKQPMTRNEFNEILVRLDACEEAQDWCAEHPRMSPQRLWETCPRADWLLWLWRGERIPLVLAAADCAESAPSHAKIPAAVECVRVLRLWADGRATLDEVRVAMEAAWATATATARVTTVGAAAWATAVAVAEAWAVVRAAVRAAEVVAAAARATVRAAGAAEEYHQKMCDIVRRRLRWPDVERGLRT